jgi:hypothetical protein
VVSLSRERLGRVGQVHDDAFQLIDGRTCVWLDKDLIYICAQDIVLICERAGLERYGRTC